MYNKIIKAFIIILFPLNLAAQKYMLSFEQFGNYSVYNFSTTLPYSIPERDLKGRLGFESLLRFYYTPKQKLSYYIGVGFTKYNYTSGKFEVKTSDQIIPKKGFIMPANNGGGNLNAVKINYSYNYLSIPIGLHYNINEMLFVGGGFTVLRGLGGYSYSKYYYADRWKSKSNFDKKQFDNDGYIPWVLNAHIEVGYTVPVFKKKVAWKAAFDYALTDYISKQYASLNLYPYTFSLGASFPLIVSGK